MRSLIPMRPRRNPMWLVRVVRALRAQWRNDMSFYFFWIKLNKTRKQARELAGRAL